LKRRTYSSIIKEKNFTVVTIHDQPKTPEAKNHGPLKDKVDFITNTSKESKNVLRPQ